MNVKQALIDDTKTPNIPGHGPITIGQLELWNSRPLITSYLLDIKEALVSFGNPSWFFTTPSIEEGMNYLYTESEDLQRILTKALNATFNGHIGQTPKLWLRKEIIRTLSNL